MRFCHFSKSIHGPVMRLAAQDQAVIEPSMWI
jgi:hypothetical protein